MRTIGRALQVTGVTGTIAVSMQRAMLRSTLLRLYSSRKAHSPIHRIATGWGVLSRRRWPIITPSSFGMVNGHRGGALSYGVRNQATSRRPFNHVWKV